ncbi:MAG: hypothetical protein ACP5JG_16780, partial [Anaerolineae bacterium]
MDRDGKAAYRPPYSTAFHGFLVLAPLVISLLVGVDSMSDAVYAAAQCVERRIWAGEFPCFSWRGDSVLTSPLFDGVLLLLALSGVPTPWAALVLSALGWSVAALVLHRVGRSLGLPIAGVATATLVAIGPPVITALGTPVSWTVAFAWLALAATLKRRRRASALAVALMLGTHLSLGTLILALGLLLYAWVRAHAVPRGLTVAIAAVLVTWIVLVSRGWIQLSRPALSLDVWTDHIGRLAGESELYWLGLPLVFAGITVLKRRSPWTAAGLVWLLVLALDGGDVAVALVDTLGLALTGVGIAGLVRWLRRGRYVEL